MLEQLSILKSFTVDNLLHTTQPVSMEYQPQNGILGSQQIDTRQINILANQVRGRFGVLGISSIDHVAYDHRSPLLSK
ncbi:MAG: hypothetical protein ABIG63_18650 [Chloroflexota bacterium]